MGKIITIAQQKGGAGKTTLAAHLALAWAESGRVAIIDIDPQASLATWFRRRRERFGALVPGIEVAALGGWRVAAEVERQAKSHDIVVIDTAPHAETEARIAVRAASLVLVPVQPSPMDLWATQPTLELAWSERRPVLLIVNRMPARSRLADEMVTKLSAFDIGVARATLGNRVAFAETMASGAGVSEAEPGSPAAQEIAALGQEIWDRTAG